VLGADWEAGDFTAATLGALPCCAAPSRCLLVDTTGAVVAARGAWGLSEARLSGALFLGEAAPARAPPAAAALGRVSRQVRVGRALGLRQSSRAALAQGLAHALLAEGFMAVRYVRGTGGAANAWQVCALPSSSDCGLPRGPCTAGASRADAFERRGWQVTVELDDASAAHGAPLSFLERAVGAAGAAARCAPARAAGVARVVWGNLLLVVAQAPADAAAASEPCAGRADTLSRRALLARHPPQGPAPPARGARARGACGGARVAACSGCFLAASTPATEVPAEATAQEESAPVSECERPEPSVVRAQQGGEGGGSCVWWRRRAGWC